jgi:NAD(P)-dependent dehydrogenase (short-subunit alcohol dehydrogenase family)
VVAITGGGRGIGAAAALRFAREGWRVAIVDRDAETLEESARALGTSCVWSGIADVTAYESLATAAASIGDRTGRVDVLVNNAGILRVGPFETISPQDAEEQVRVNVLGVINGVYAFFERLRTTPGARVINLASASSIYGTPDFAVYSATKFAVRGLTEALEINSGVTISACATFRHRSCAAGCSRRKRSFPRASLVWAASRWIRKR